MLPAVPGGRRRNSRSADQIFGGEKIMKFLIAEDDFTSRKLLQRTLEKYGMCDVAVNGKEALTAFTEALKKGEKYDLICLDIMMPELDGHGVITKVRDIEVKNGIGGLDGVKIVMVSGLDDTKNVLTAFREGCEAYITKPLDRKKLFEHLRSFGLIE